MRLLPTISRLFADYSATALRLFRACAGSRAGICVQFRRGRAACLGGRSGSRNAGRPRAALARRAAGSAEDLRARARIWAGDIKVAREMPLFAPELPFKRTFVLYGYTVYPRYKRAVYARFRGYFAAVQKIAPKNAGALHRAGDREKPRQASSLSGRVFTWSFSPRQ